VIFYVGWYGLIVGSLLYFLINNVRSFKKLQTYIIITQILSVIIYIAYPTRQNLRPQLFPRENMFTKLLGVIYRIDTPTGVFPSLHVAISLAIASVWLREKTVKLWVRIGLAMFCLGVCLSVAFVKQHSVLDIFGAIAVCLPAEWFVSLRKQTGME
jgi:membrane-associated phospholipid phosphatase